MPDLGFDSPVAGTSFDPLLTASSGPAAEAKTTTVSNWFYYLGAGLGDALDGNVRAPVANAGVNFGVAADGSIFVQGQAAGQGQQAKSAAVTLSPSILLIGFLVFMLIRKS